MLMNADLMSVPETVSVRMSNQRTIHEDSDVFVQQQGTLQ